MRRISRTACVAAIAAAATVIVVPQAMASALPRVAGLSTHHGAYWGGRVVTVTGSNFTNVRQVKFGSRDAWSVHVISSTKLTAVEPYHGYDTVYVRVFTSAGESSRSSAAAFTFTRPSMNDPIQGGLTGHQEQRISARVRADHKHVHLAHRSRHWTPAMGRTAARRAASYIGVPYSWAGGNGRRPTTGVCAHNGGDLDCHIVGFDCSGLTLYSWWPYIHLAHYAATQHYQAGRFHPSIGQLVPGDLVYFTGYIPGGIGHTAIYAGHGMVIQAPQSGEQVERSRLVDVINDSGRWRGATRPVTTRRLGPGPRVTAVTKAVSAKGGTMSIWGHSLAGTTSVRVGGKTLYWFHTASSRHLTVKVPAHTPGSVHVDVSNAWGTAHRSLTYVSTPSITSLSTASGPAAGGNKIVVTGRHLGRVTKATVGTTSVAVHPLSAYRASLTMPAHQAGGVRIELASAFGRSNALSYTYAAPVTSTPPKTLPRTTTTPPKTITSPGPSTSPTTSAPVTSTPTAPSSTPTGSPTTSPTDGSTSGSTSTAPTSDGPTPSESSSPSSGASSGG